MKLSQLTDGNILGRSSRRRRFCQVLVMLKGYPEGPLLAVAQKRMDGRWVSLYEDGISGSGRSWGPGPLDGDGEEPGR